MNNNNPSKNKPLISPKRVTSNEKNFHNNQNRLSQQLINRQKFTQNMFLTERN
jgi:hypothetical protein